MQKNVGNVDRVVRIVVGLALLSLLLLLEGNARWLGLVGIVLIATGFMRWCPGYGLIGLNTCPLGDRGAKA